MKNIIDSIIKIFSEDNGSPSSMRSMMFFIIVVVMFNWTWINIKTGTIVPMDWSNLGLIIGPLGFKAWQKGKEGKNK